MLLDRSFGQNHLKVKGCQVFFICCKFTKVPVLLQTVLTFKVKGYLVCFICGKFTKVPVLWQTVLTLTDGSFCGSRIWICIAEMGLTVPTSQV